MTNIKFKQKFSEKFEWATQINSEDSLLLSNDLDSLFSCAFLNHKFGAKVKAFYDFETIYYNDLTEIQGNSIIGVDTALYNIRTYDNHHIRIDRNDEYNKQAFNVNASIVFGAFEQYAMKYSGSTLLQILSFYGYEDLYLEGHTDLTDTQKMILLTIDTTFKGLYKNYEYHRAWCDGMGITDKFYNVLQANNMDDMYKFIGDHNIAEDIKVVDGDLVSQLDINFIQQHFPMLDFSAVMPSFSDSIFVGKSKSKKVASWDMLDFYKDKFSAAMIFKDKMMITQVENKEIYELGVFGYEQN